MSRSVAGGERVDSAQCRRQLVAAGYDIAQEVDRLAEFYESIKDADANAH